MTKSKFNSAVVMGFFAATVGLVVICSASVQSDEPQVQHVKSEIYAPAYAEDVRRP